MPEPAVWSVERLKQEPLGRVTLWASPSVHEMVAQTLPWSPADVAAGISAETETLVVVGGGSLLDHAKAQRHDTAPHTRLIAVPSIWGSGAEASPIVVTTLPDRKDVRIGDAFLPDARVVWPALAETVPPRLATYACGDTWAHALEGFLCPLASRDLRVELAGIMNEMLTLPIGADARWFELSARACAGQARSGVGLVHGIAHVLEPVLRAAEPSVGWGHARLCSAYLSPILTMLTTVTEKAAGLLREYGLDQEQIEAAARSVYSDEDYAETLPFLVEHWPRILRDPCTRTSCVLIRSTYLSYLQR